MFFTFFGIGMFVFLLVFGDFVVAVVLLCVFCFVLVLLVMHKLKTCFLTLFLGRLYLENLMFLLLLCLSNIFWLNLWEPTTTCCRKCHKFFCNYTFVTFSKSFLYPRCFFSFYVFFIATNALTTTGIKVIFLMLNILAIFSLSVLSFTIFSSSFLFTRTSPDKVTSRIYRSMFLLIIAITGRSSSILILH